MQATLELDLGDGPFRVTTNLWAMTLWERKFKRKASDFANGVGVEDMAFLAYECCKQQNIVVPVVFDDFIKKLVKLEPVEEVTPTPTAAAPTAEG